VSEVTDVATAAGQFAHRTFQVTPNSSGQLRLQFSDTGGDPYWVANGISLWSAPVGGLTVTGPSGSNEYTVTGLTSGLVYTVSATAGTLGLTDADPYFAGLQVVAGSGSLTIPVTPPAGGGVATVTVEEAAGSQWGAVTATYSAAAVRRYDFNGSGNFTQSGFVGVRGSAVYSPALGYGWDGPVSEFQRTSGSSLRRDGHYGYGSTAHTFQIKVDPGVTYSVRVYAGDATYKRDRMEVTVEGASPYTIGSLAAGSFDVRTTAGVSADDVLRVTIRDLGGDPYWVINGIDIWSPAGTDPGAQPLQAAVSGERSAVSGQLSANSGQRSEIRGQRSEVTLSSLQPVVEPVLSTQYSVRGPQISAAQLAPVVEQAVGIWAGTGLSPAQVSALRAIPVGIMDLDDRGYLGLTTPERILIDDDGSGLGWWLPGGKGVRSLFPERPAGCYAEKAPDPFSASSYDLLTVVLHELGHALGRGHEEGDELMEALLRPGERHLPAVDGVFAGW
jgi:hypothetical protein